MKSAASIKNQEIHISKFGDPFLSKHPVFIWGPLACGKLNMLQDIMSKKSINYHTMSGYGYKFTTHVMEAIEMWWMNNYAVILDDFNISESSVEEMLNKYHESKNIFLVGHFSNEEDIPNYIKANFRVIKHTDISELN